MKRQKKMMLWMVAAVLALCSVSCKKQEAVQQEHTAKPQVTKMKSICELATMDCYYHNVAKYKEKDVEGALFWKKDKHFWIEYSGVVKLGVDASLLQVSVDNDKVTITLPPAKVISSKVDESSLTEDSFYIEKNSAKVTAEDQKNAYSAAQINMEKQASEDAALLLSAQQRAQTLLEEYIENIGKITGTEYQIEWVEPAAASEEKDS